MNRARLRRGLLLAFVVYHALAVGLLSLPAPTGARADGVWKDPHTRAQVLSWTRPLRALGVVEDAEGQLRLARRVATTILDARGLIIAPFQPYARAVGAGQGWQMFATLNDTPARLALEIRRGPEAPWEMVYLGRDPERAWRRELLDEERVRAFTNDWSWERDRADYRLFARWLAKGAAAEWPDATSARVSMMRARLPTPEELARGEKPAERATWVESFDLSALRGGAGR